MLGVTGLWILLVLLPTGLSASRQNAAADAVVKYGIALGIDPDPDNPDAAHPSRADAESRERADIFGWLNGQIEDRSDEIGKPPAALREYLSAHEDDLRALVAALQKDAPDWGEPPEGEYLGKHFLLTMRVSRTLLAAALVGDFDSNFIESGQALEAS